MPWSVFVSSCIPVVITDSVEFLGMHVQMLSESNVAVEFSFILGALPVAPTLYTFAQQYGVDTKLISLAVVVCLIVSTPMLFVSSVFVSANNMKLQSLR